MDVTWDVSQGKAPWTVTIAPINYVPTTVQVPEDYLPSSKSWTYSWDVPSFSDSINQLLVSVSDSTGQVSGVTKLQNIDSSSSKCSTAPESLDFFFYVPKAQPNQCEPWKIKWEEEKGSNGLKYPVQVVILPEDSQPISYSIEDSKTTSIDWTASLPEGTDFTIALYDAGKSGTGGVGGKYTVGKGKVGGQCLGKIGVGGENNLLGASTTLKPTSTGKKGGMSTQRASKTGGGHGASETGSADSDDSSKASNLNDDGTEKKSSSTGAAVGGVFAALAVIGIAVAGVWYYRKRKSEEDGIYGVKAGQGHSGRGANSSSEGGVGEMIWAPFAAVGAWFSERASGNHHEPQVGYPSRQTGQFSSSFSGPNHPDPRNGGQSGMMAERNGAGMSTTSLIMRNGPSFPQDPNAPQPFPSPNGEARDPFSSNPNSQHGHGDRGHSSSFGAGLGQNLHSRKSGSIHARSVYSIVPDEALFPPPAPRTVPDEALVPPIRPGSIKSGPPSITSGHSTHGHSNYGLSVNQHLPSDPLTPGTIPGTPIRGDGAGIGTWNAQERRESNLKFTNQQNRRAEPSPRENHGQEREREYPFPALSSSQPQAQAPGSNVHQNLTPSQNQIKGRQGQSPNRRSYHEAQDSTDTGYTQRTSNTQQTSNTNKTFQTSSTNRTVQPLGTDYIPPPMPIKTSVHDPYSHMSQLYENGIGREFWETDEDRRMMGEVPEIPSHFRNPHQELEEEEEKEVDSRREPSRAPRIPSMIGRATSPFLLPGEEEDEDDRIPISKSTSGNSLSPPRKPTNLPSLTAQALSMNESQSTSPSKQGRNRNGPGSNSIEVKKNGDAILANLEVKLRNERRASHQRPVSALSEASSSDGLPYL